MNGLVKQNKSVFVVPHNAGTFFYYILLFVFYLFIYSFISSVCNDLVATLALNQ